MTHCKDGPQTFNYMDVSDKDGKLLYKYSPSDSCAIIYLDNNERYLTGKLKNSKPEGTWKEYITKDNELSFKWSFKNGIKDGTYFGYTLTGKIETVGNHKDDMLDGTLVYFDLKFRPKKVQVWKGVDRAGGYSVMTFEKMLQ